MATYVEIMTRWCIFWLIMNVYLGIVNGLYRTIWEKAEEKDHSWATYIEVVKQVFMVTWTYAPVCLISTIYRFYTEFAFRTTKK